MINRNLYLTFEKDIISKKERFKISKKDFAELKYLFRKKIIFISGAAGSIGSQFSRDFFHHNFKPKKRKEIKPTGFIVGLKNIYLSTNIGKLLVIDIKSGKTISTLKIDKDKISRPFISNQNLYLAIDNAIIKLN